MGSTESGCKVCSSFQEGAVAIAWLLVCLIPIQQYYSANKVVSFATMNQHVASASIAIAASAVQTLGIISSFAVDMQSGVDSVAKGIEFITLLDLDEIFSTNCSYGIDPVTKYILRCAAFYAVLLLFYIYLFLSKLAPRDKQWQNVLALNAIATLLGTLCITLFKTAMDPMMCYSHPIDESSLRKYPVIVCGSSKHIVMLIFGLSLLLSALGFLAYVIWVSICFPRSSLFHNRVQGDEFYKMTRFIHFNYVPKVCFWRVVQLIRALCLSLCTVMFPNDVHAQMVACLFVLLVPLMMTTHFRPWRVPFANELDMIVAMVTISVLVLVSCFLGKVENPSTYSTLYMVMLVFICLCFAATILKLVLSYFTSDMKFADWKQDKPAIFFMKGLRSRRFARWRQACEDSVTHRQSFERKSFDFERKSTDKHSTKVTDDELNEETLPQPPATDAKEASKDEALKPVEELCTI